MKDMRSNRGKASKASKLAFLISIIILGASFGFGQEKRVKVLRLEVDGQEVKSDFHVDLISGEKNGKVYKAKTDKSGFVVPAELVGKDVGVILRFKKYTAIFFFVSAANFDHDWTVGVDTKPFADELVSASDPPDTEIIYYVKLDKDAKASLITTVGKPKITVKQVF